MKHKYYKDIQKKYYEKTKEEKKKKVYANKLKRAYNFTVDEYNVLLKEQNYACRICKTTEPTETKTKFCIDHDHVTGKVRGLLCNKCNAGIGMFNDNIDLLISAIAYIKETS